MSQSLTVKVSNRYQIALPSAARQQLHISSGDRLLVDIQDNILLLIPQPDDYVTRMAGLHRDIWTDIDSTNYLRDERDAWTPSSAANA